MEAAARKAETQAGEKDAEVRNRIAQARGAQVSEVVEPGATGGATKRSVGALLGRVAAPV